MMREVTGCADCSMVVDAWNGKRCALDDGRRRSVSYSRVSRGAGSFVLHVGLHKTAPKWCPLHRGPVTLKLRGVR